MLSHILLTNDIPTSVSIWLLLSRWRAHKLLLTCLDPTINAIITSAPNKTTHTNLNKRPKTTWFQELIPKTMIIPTVLILPRDVMIALMLVKPVVGSNLSPILWLTLSCACKFRIVLVSLLLDMTSTNIL